MVDYETLTDESGKRLIAFGRWAGIVGAHNGMLTWGKRQGTFNLKAMHECFDFEEAKTHYNNLNLKGLKVVISGSGRVSQGAAEVLDLMGIKRLEAEEFLNYNGTDAVYCMLNTELMFAKGENNDFEAEYYRNPTGYHSLLAPYLKQGNLLINGIYWDNRAPALFSKEDMKTDEFNIQVIADVTCDIAPVASIPSTLKATTIAEPIFGYNVETEQEDTPYQKNIVDMMTIDNLPNELPRDASSDFGKQFIEFILPELLIDDSKVIYRASISTKEGQLNEPYLYLSNYIS